MALPRTGANLSINANDTRMEKNFVNRDHLICVQVVDLAASDSDGQISPGGTWPMVFGKASRW